MSGTSKRGAFTRRSLAALIAAAATMVVFVVMLTGSAGAGTYTQVQTLPVPPASSFAGSGGGDGWAVTLSSDKVFNVFHHNNGTRNNDNTSGVVCFDTLLAATNPNPYCGFTPLSGVGEGQVIYWGMLSAPIQVGSKLYAFNYVNGAAQGGPSGTGAQNKVLCFDLATDAACAGQPFAVSLGSGSALNALYGAYAGNAAAIGSQLIIPVIMDGVQRVTCFDTATASTCGGSFPVDLTIQNANGAPFPLLTAAGALSGFCLPAGSIPCYSTTGASVATPAGLTSSIFPSEPWNGPAVTIGPRVYVPNGNQNGYSGTVECFDYSTGAGCANFPKTFNNLSYLYTVNADPARPTASGSTRTTAAARSRASTRTPVVPAVPAPSACSPRSSSCRRHSAPRRRTRRSRSSRRRATRTPRARSSSTTAPVTRLASRTARSTPPARSTCRRSA